MSRAQTSRTRRTPARVAPVVVLTAALLVLTGCEPDAPAANDLDRSRAAALVEVLWFNEDWANPGGPAVTGPDRPYERPYTNWYEDGEGTPTEAVRAHVARARAAGWVPVYGLCDDLVQDETDEGEPFTRSDEIVVHLARTLPDGSPANAEMLATRTGAGRFDLGVDVYALYHLDTVTPEPFEEVSLDSLLCVGEDGDRETVGTPMPLERIGTMAGPSWE
ncbi:hypothetical protein [Sanguibacter sp. 25GB23B1]|uniref:hypothetical protein n=1 Tax=unclassified Sanguibacter TaxID=2645534 RepID=UPI0032B0206D